MNNKKVVVIDLDDVIIDTDNILRELIEEIVEKTMQVFNSNIEKEKLIFMVYNKYNELCQKIGNHDFNLYLAFDFLVGFLLGYEWNTSISALTAQIITLDNLVWDMKNYLTENLKITEGGLELLSKLFDNDAIESIVVYMNGHGNYQEVKAQEVANLLGNDKYFTDMYVTPRKDEQTLFALLDTCEHIKNKDNVIVISNKLYEDIIPARKLGAEAIFVDLGKKYFGVDKYIQKYNIKYAKNALLAIKELNDLINESKRVA